MQGGDAVLILAVKTLPEQLDIDVMEGLRAKAMYHGELTDIEHGLAAMPRAGSTLTVGLRRMTVPLRAMQMIADAEEGPDVVEDNFIEELLTENRVW